MGQHSEVFIGIDTSKSKNAVAVAAAGREGEVRYLGEFDTTEAATARWIAKLAAKHAKLTFCYEAGPTGYGLQRQIERLGHRCLVVAPSLIPRKAGDHVKTNRRDAIGLARNLRAGELTAVWVPDGEHEAMRDLSRARAAAVDDLKCKRQQVCSLLLRHGLHYPRKKRWGKMHRTWLAQIKLPHAQQRFVLEELLGAERQAQGRIDRIAAQIRSSLPDWALAKVVTALCAVRGIDTVSAVTLLAEIGDLTRFASPRELMGFLGLVPIENSTGDKVRRGGISKAGNARARTTLVEAAWSYRHPPRIGATKRAKVEAVSEPVREIAWKAQARLTKRYRELVRRGKKSVVAVTAIARELAGFIWAIGQEVRPTATVGAR